MPPLTTFIILSFAVYAIIKWWFDTDIVDHILAACGCDLKLTEIRSKFYEGGLFKRLLAELSECPWCLSFHFSLWINILWASLPYNFNDWQTFSLNVIAAAGGGMFLWQNDLKD